MDTNENSSADPGETDLQGVNITLAKPNQTDKITETSSPYTFKNLPRFRWQGGLLPKPATYLFTFNSTDKCIKLSHQRAEITPQSKTETVQIFAVGACLSGNLYEDNNGNGIQDRDEKPADYLSDLNYSSVRLDPTENDTSPISATADLYGNFVFQNVPRYQEATYPKVALIHYNLDPVRDCYRITQATKPLIFSQNSKITAGLAYSCLSGTVYHDRNADNKIDENDNGLNGATVELHLPNQNQIATSTTVGPDGSFLFKNLAQSVYNVTASKQYFTSVSTQPIVANLSPTLELNIGMSCSCIDGYAFIDANRNLKMDPGEKALDNFAVNAHSFKLNESGQAVTGPDGYFIIPELKPSKLSDNYLMGFSPGLSYENVDPRMNNTITIPPDGLYNIPMAIRTDNQNPTGHAFIDENNNGVQDRVEPALAGMAVWLYQNGGGQGNHTDPLGNFDFPGNYSGYYSLGYKLPQGFTAAGADSAGFVNEVLLINAETPPILIPVTRVSKQQETAKGGSYKISGSVFYDDNGNGIKDAGEAPAPGMYVSVLQMQADVFSITPNQWGMVTDTDGNFSLDKDYEKTAPPLAPSGTYHLSVDNQDKKFTPTTPLDQFFILNSDKVVNFGVQLKQ